MHVRQQGPTDSSRTEPGNPYESRAYLDQYLLFHWGQPRDLHPIPFIPPGELQFHQRIVDECILPVSFGHPTHGLDIGCAVGAFTFELGRVVDHVVGVDNSHAFIEAARRMAECRRITVDIKEFGNRVKSRTLVLPSRLKNRRVEFRVGDATDPALFGCPPVHVVAAINLICRLPSPAVFLGQLHKLVVPGGQLILASPFTWLEKYTAPAEWLDSAKLTRILRPHFRLARHRELPFIIREHRRMYQLILSQVWTWVRT